MHAFPKNRRAASTLSCALAPSAVAVDGNKFPEPESQTENRNMHQRAFQKGGCAPGNIGEERGRIEV